MHMIQRSAVATVGGAILAAAALGASGFPVKTSAANVSPCAACESRAARHFLGSSRVIDCQPGNTADEAHLRRALGRCEQRYACASGGPDALVTALGQLVDGVEAKLCGQPSGGGPGWGQVIDLGTVRGPVGQVPPAVDPAAAPSFDDVAAFCRAHRDYDAPPPLLALPAVSQPAEWCDEDQAYANLVETCGPPRVVAVAKGADPASADGSAAAPFASITDALAACRGRACHLVIGPGTYVESPSVSRCTFLEGGVRIEAGVATRGATRPRVEGSIGARGNAIVVARVDVQGPYGALSSDGDVLVSEAVLRGGYEGGSSAFSATGPRICRTHIAAGYSGFDIAWHSSRLWIAGSAVSTCYEGAALSWGSRGLKVLDSVMYGGYEAVGTSWGSVDVEVRRNRLGSAYAAVDIHIAPDDHDVFPSTFDVIVTGNSIASGTLPASNPALNIVVQDNPRE